MTALSFWMSEDAAQSYDLSGAELQPCPYGDWLQCEWWDWRIPVANVTEQYAQIAIVAKMPAGYCANWAAWMSLPRHAFSHGERRIRFRCGVRISFSGELKTEIPLFLPRQGHAFWNRADCCGRRVWRDAHGTEALHIMQTHRERLYVDRG
jgi:sarcosine oxidase subunit alpha